MEARSAAADAWERPPARDICARDAEDPLCTSKAVPAGRTRSATVSGATCTFQQLRRYLLVDAIAIRA